MTICHPAHLDSRAPRTLRLKVVRVHEKNVRAGIDPVEWRLITYEPIDSADDVAAIVDGYRARWLMIEAYVR